MQSTTTLLNNAIIRIDDFNKQDPNLEKWEDKEYPKELLYSMRMTKCLRQFAPDASDSLKIAVRAQHIGRWKIPRTKYEADRKGYLLWRNDLKEMHAHIASEILEDVGYDQLTIQNVTNLIQKKELKKNQETQTLEDVICLVFLQYYLADFADTKDEEKIIEITVSPTPEITLTPMDPTSC